MDVQVAEALAEFNKQLNTPWWRAFDTIVPVRHVDRTVKPGTKLLVILDLNTFLVSSEADRKTVIPLWLADTIPENKAIRLRNGSFVRKIGPYVQYWAGTQTEKELGGGAVDGVGENDSAGNGPRSKAVLKDSSATEQTAVDHSLGTDGTPDRAPDATVSIIECLPPCGRRQNECKPPVNSLTSGKKDGNCAGATVILSRSPHEGSTAQSPQLLYSSWDCLHKDWWAQVTNLEKARLTPNAVVDDKTRSLEEFCQKNKHVTVDRVVKILNSSTLQHPINAVAMKGRPATTTIVLAVPEDNCQVTTFLYGDFRDSAYELTAKIQCVKNCVIPKNKCLSRWLEASILAREQGTPLFENTIVPFPTTWPGSFGYLKWAMTRANTHRPSYLLALLPKESTVSNVKKSAYFLFAITVIGVCEIAGLLALIPILVSSPGLVWEIYPETAGWWIKISTLISASAAFVCGDCTLRVLQKLLAAKLAIDGLTVSEIEKARGVRSLSWGGVIVILTHLRSGACVTLFLFCFVLGLGVISTQVFVASSSPEPGLVSFRFSGYATVIGLGYLLMVGTSFVLSHFLDDVSKLHFGVRNAELVLTQEFGLAYAMHRTKAAEALFSHNADIEEILKTYGDMRLLFGTSLGDSGLPRMQLGSITETAVITEPVVCN